MWTIILTLFIGMLIGAREIIPEKFLKYNGKFQHLGVIILLFAMGTSIGFNQDLLNSISSIGFKALTFAVLTSLFSIVFVYFITKFFMKEGDC